MDTLFQNVTAVLMDEDCTVLNGAYVGVDAGKITYIDTVAPWDKHPSSADGMLLNQKMQTTAVVNGTGKVLIPGIINAHTHLPMTLLRGFADDMDLQTWLFEHIFPAEEKLTPETIHWGTLLALMECAASGTVSVTDMYSFVAPAVAESGMKGNLCLPLIQPGVTEYCAKDDKRLKDAVKLADDYHSYDNGRIFIDAAIHAEYTSCPAMWEAAAEFARERGLGMHVHLSETAKEHNDCVAKYGLTPTAVFDKYGLFSARTTAAHCVHITEEDMDILAARGVTAVHNPVSNLKLASGVARVRAMRAHGVNAALGTDGAASNNNLDMFEEIKLAAILGGSGDDFLPLPAGEKPLTAEGSLCMATRSGAASQGRFCETGTIAVGYDADLVLVDFNRPHLTPCYNAVSSLVYSARGSDVCLTMVRGRVIYKDGEFFTMDKERILYEANKASRIF